MPTLRACDELRIHQPARLDAVPERNNQEHDRPCKLFKVILKRTRFSAQYDIPDHDKYLYTPVAKNAKNGMMAIIPISKISGSIVLWCVERHIEPEIFDMALDAPQHDRGPWPDTPRSPTIA